jgi:hypothetical protein
MRWLATTGAKGNRKYWEVPPQTCQLIPLQKEKRDCATDEEYEAFAASLMEQQYAQVLPRKARKGREVLIALN